MSATPATFQVSEVVQIAPSRQLAVVVAVTPAGGVSVMRHPSGTVTPFAPGALDSRHKRDSRCACRGFDDGSVYRSLCPVHADTDPCLTMSQVTGRRRKGTIRRGVCTSCGWRVPRYVVRKDGVHNYWGVWDVREDTWHTDADYAGATYAAGVPMWPGESGAAAVVRELSR